MQYVMINERGDKFYYSDKEMTIPHRLDGPAREYFDGNKEWYVNGKLHRLDGPAIECANGDEAWCINGESISEDEFFKRTDWREDQHIVDLRYLRDLLSIDIETASEKLKTSIIEIAIGEINEMHDEAMENKRSNGFLG